MKPQDFATLALRVLAVFIVSKSLIQFGQITTALTSVSGTTEAVQGAGIVTALLLGPVLLAAVIWWGAPFIARLASRDLGYGHATGLDAHTVLNTTFIVVGSLVFLTSLPKLIAEITQVIQMPQQMRPGWLIGHTLQCLLGVALVIGTRGFSRFTLWLRTAGTNG